MLIVGLDAATDPRKFGYAIGRLSGRTVRIVEAGTLQSAKKRDALVEAIAPRLRKASRALVAIDAPLGWPAGAGAAFTRHTAGQRIELAPDKLFHRATDQFVQARLRKRPLEVGASLIARAAHSALRTLQELRQATDLDIPLAWDPGFQGVAAIEVYPGASLIAWGQRLDGYKKSADLRRRIALALKSRASGIVDCAIDSSDAFDAALCVLAGVDFPMIKLSRSRRVGSGARGLMTESAGKCFLVSCVGQKANSARPARDLYLSDWFVKARRYVEQASSPWFILSAEFGLVHPEKVVPPYEKSLNHMGVAERRAWAQRVIGQLERDLPPSDEIVVLAGQRYREFLMDFLRAKAQQVHVPLEGLRIGEQLSWLGEHVAKRASE